MLTFYARTDCATIWVFTVKWPDAKCKANTVPPAAIPAPPSQSIFAFPGKQHHCWKQTPSGSRFPVNCSILPRLSFGCLKVTLKSYTQTNMTAGIWFLYLFSEMKSASRLVCSCCSVNSYKWLNQKHHCCWAEWQWSVFVWHELCLLK